MNILDTIVAQKRREVAHLPARPVTPEAIRSARRKPRGFYRRLAARPRSTGRR